MHVWEFISLEKLTLLRLWLSYFDRDNAKQIDQESLQAGRSNINHTATSVPDVLSGQGLERIGLKLTEEEAEILFADLKGRSNPRERNPTALHRVHRRYSGPTISNEVSEVHCITADDFNDAAKQYRAQENLAY